MKFSKFVPKSKCPKKMNNLFKAKTLASFGLLILAMASCSKEEISMDSQLKVSNATTVTTNDMIGHWDLSGMMADTAVNLNGDELSSKNLLDETDCFNTMSITFDADSTFVTNNAQMTFESGTSSNEFSCLTDRMDNGRWEVRNDSLILTMMVNGSTYTHKKLINLETNKFSFDVTKIESDQYVDDPGNTQASPIRILELEYTKS
ncbi:lipocalin family protein [Christiangramia sp. SM2212]|uniref:Lipocalin family protein n=1 Tax=Christiangramia sediminicola TaxID=3073267 RepID=A0ABU1ELR4_9FLAO|nr:lipocalin family protein [Christiangramia sp. SM2212]MDR5589316.1 lipocalin family protein [Christiangramia sp. SM2212]